MARAAAANSSPLPSCVRSFAVTLIIVRSRRRSLAHRAYRPLHRATPRHAASTGVALQCRQRARGWTQMAGPLALAGSGEFLESMTEIDRRLLDAAGRKHGPAVIVPTASALEPGKPEEWADLGVRHFSERLHVDAEAALVLDAATADARFVPLVERARLIYFSGGNPQYVTEAMRDTPFWSAVLSAWRDGAALAGCSAGAMMMAGRLASIVGRTGP